MQPILEEGQELEEVLQGIAEELENVKHQTPAAQAKTIRLIGDQLSYMGRAERRKVGRKLRLTRQYGAPPGQRPKVYTREFNTADPQQIALLYIAISEEISGQLDYLDPRDQDGFRMSIQWDDE